MSKAKKKATHTIDKRAAKKLAQEWHSLNPWFGVDEERTLQALKLHEQIINRGIDPKSLAYWQAVDEGLRGPDLVNHPPHYKSGGVETIDFIEAKQLGFCLGNVVKYISRAGIKSHNPLEDLKKAQWYLNREVQRLEKLEAK